MQISDFIASQLARWPEAAARFDVLNAVEVKEVTLPRSGAKYSVQFNPARAVSTRAKVDPKSIAARPCFLCEANRPPQQIAVDWEDLQILVNPFPIFPCHLTIAARKHIPQTLSGRLAQMRRLSRHLPGYTVFFNGAKCGASAPDHFHFQAVPSQYLRVPDIFWSYELGDDVDELCAEGADPMINAICTDGRIRIIPRRKHRPDCYSSVHLSPAAIDLCGVMISVSRDEFDRIDGKLIENVIEEVTFSEPPVYVGLTGNDLQFSTLPGGLHEVSGVTIGKDFHWQQQLNLRYSGTMLRLADGQLINRIGLEEYLLSVISSEMNATAHPEFLKAHAVISRSWLMAQLRATRADAALGSPVAETDCEPDEVCQWFDRDDHLLFDVCSDDHCQRYQGVTRQTSPSVFEAVNRTRGLVLMDDDGKIADARFSKCCGGYFEQFENCWQPRHHSYLIGLRDAPGQDVKLNLSDEEAARQWILGSPDAFCNCADRRLLGQVLNDFDLSTTPDFFRWEVKYASKELSELIAQRSGIDFGTILRLEPLARGSSGRIYRLRIVGSKRSMVIGKELLIRKWLSSSHLKSSAFVVEQSASEFIIHGAGWGHGVGLCQIGAAVMADRGYSYCEILKHYFPNTSLKCYY